jgi:Ca-activated chloride channel family protein
MQFGDPQVFWLLLLLPVLSVFYFWAFRKKKRALETFGSPALMKKLTSATSKARQWVKAGLMAGGFLFLILALVQPQFGTKLEMIQRRGVDLIILLDTSLSMLAQDIKPDRLTRARYEIADLLDRLKGDRVGIVAFAGRPHVLCPLTLDYGAAKLLLDTVDTHFIPVQGTAVADAIRTAVRSFGATETKYKAMILITDGENHVDDPVAAAREASKAGVRIFVVGVGTPEGELIPIHDGGRVDYLKDRNGNIVKTRLDEPTLQEIAQVSDGLYVRASGGGIGLKAVYDRIDEMEKRDFGSKRYTQYIHRFQWPLALALMCFFGEALLSDRRRKADEWHGRFES